MGLRDGWGPKSPVEKRFVSQVLRVQFDAVDRSVFADVGKATLSMQRTNYSLFSTQAAKDVTLS